MAKLRVFISLKNHLKKYLFKNIILLLFLANFALNSDMSIVGLIFLSNDSPERKLLGYYPCF
jgi:hypothetical protein